MKKNKELVSITIIFVVIVIVCVFFLFQNEQRKKREQALNPFWVGTFTNNIQKELVEISKNSIQKEKEPKIDIAKLHLYLIPFCKKELEDKNYFHAVLEGAKSIAERVRKMTNLTTDGASLFEKVFNISNPLIKINNLSNDSEKSEQKGFMNILIGYFGKYRNFTAHEPKINAVELDEDWALDALTRFSIIHKELDKAQVCQTEPVS